MCIAAERGLAAARPACWIAHARTLRFFAERMPQEHGWFFHFINLQTGAREWQSELSSIDTALLLSGVLTVRRCFDGDREMSGLPTPSIAAWTSMDAGG